MTSLVRPFQGEPLRVPMSGTPVPVWNGLPGSPPIMLYNFDTSNSIYVGYTRNISIGAPNTQLLQPQFGLTMDGTRTIYAIGVSGAGPLQVTPGGGAPFQVPSLSGLGGSNIYVQPLAPTGVIPLNSLWLNTTLGALEAWNGSAWVIQAFTGTQLITAGTIATNLLIANFFSGYEIDGAIFRAKNVSGATIMTINKSNGVWILYVDLGSATQGPMAASGNNTTGGTITDEFGNTVLGGVASYAGSSGAWTATTYSANNISFVTSTNTTQTGWVTQDFIQFPTGAAMLISAGGNNVSFGSSDQVLIGDGFGPFISGEVWHSVTLPTTGGFTGTIRVKKLPWKAVWLDVQVRWTGTTATTYTCGSLPSAGYYPTTGTPRFFNISYGDTPNADSLGNIAVPASGALTLFTTSSTSGSGTVGQYGCSVIYPTD